MDGPPFPCSCITLLLSLPGIFYPVVGVLGLFDQQKLIRGQMRNPGKLLDLMLQHKGRKMSNRCPYWLQGVVGGKRFLKWVERMGKLVGWAGSIA